MRNTRLVTVVVPLVGLLLAPVTGAGTAWGEHLIERVSVATGGGESNDASGYASISADGRRVAFGSYATNLVAGDTNTYADAFVRDRQAAETTRVNVSAAGVQADWGCFGPAMSGDGLHSVFESHATNIAPEDTDYCPGVFVHDSPVSETHSVSINYTGEAGHGYCQVPSVSSDGQVVAFCSTSSVLVPGDTNSERDVFVRDRAAGTTTRVSVTSSGAEAHGMSWGPSVSANGRYVAFASSAPDLVVGDTNGRYDVFVHDRVTHTTVRVSVTSEGAEGTGSCDHPCISADGRYVAFQSSDTNLVPGDTNIYIDVFVHDCVSGANTRVSGSGATGQANGHSIWPSITGDGRFVAFMSDAANLVLPADTNLSEDVFVHDTLIHETIRVSLSIYGDQANRNSGAPSIAADPPHAVAFWSDAANLVPGDTNEQTDVFVAFQGPLAVRWPRDTASVAPPTAHPPLLRRLWAVVMDRLAVAC